MVSLQDFITVPQDEDKISVRAHRESSDSNRYNVTISVNKQVKEPFSSVIYLKSKQPGGESVPINIKYDPSEEVKVAPKPSPKPVEKPKPPVKEAPAKKDDSDVFEFDKTSKPVGQDPEPKKGFGSQLILIAVGTCCVILYFDGNNRVSNIL